MKNLAIGIRLTLVFTLILLLLLAVTLSGLWRMNGASEMTRDMIHNRLPNERMVDEWFKVIEVNAARTTTAWRATEPEEQKAIEATMKASSARATEIQDTLAKTISDPGAKAALAQVLETRKAYTAARKKVFDEKAAGNMDAAKDIFEHDMAGKREAYLASLAKLSMAQRAALDSTGTAIEANYASGRVIMIVLGLMAVALSALCAWLITRSITGPIAEAVRVARSVSAGDLTSVIVIDRADETGQLMTALKGMNDNLVALVGQLRSGTDTISTASAEIAAGNMDLSSRTEAQASSLEETAASMEELTSTVKHNAASAQEANRLASDATDVARQGGDVVGEVVSTMANINDSSRKIVDIISVIDGIAFQTNILALNAAVEAARAGEQGRGFAVVAGEVRNLAQRSAAAAKEIKQLIGDSVDKVDAGSRLVEKAGATMQNVVASIGRLSGLVGEISVASNEQQEGIEQVNVAITQMDGITQENAALVEQAAAAAASMQEQAEQLARLVGTFKLAHQPVAPAALRQRPGRRPVPPPERIAAAG
jgi:methyl-accepting chemotaxis protein